MLDKLIFWTTTQATTLLILCLMLAAMWTLFWLMLSLAERAFSKFGDLKLLVEYLRYRDEFREWRKGHGERPAG